MAKRIEITEDVLRIGADVYQKGAVDWFDNDAAQMIIDRGWGKDVETGEQGERKPGAEKIKPVSVAQA